MTKIEEEIDSLDGSIGELKERLEEDGIEEDAKSWVYYVVKYLPIPIARKVMLIRGWFHFQYMCWKHGRDEYEVMLNKEIAKYRQMETQMKKDEKNGLRSTD